MKPLFEGEFVERITLRPEIFENPERLLLYGAINSMSAWAEARYKHYNGYGVGAAMPVYDDEGNAKMLNASNYRPDPQTVSGDIRVCAEQALIDSAAEEGDRSLGVLFVRGPRPQADKPIVGNPLETKTLHLCRPCRGRVLEVIGPELLVVTYIDDAAEPTEAMTLGQMLGYHDAGMPYPELPDGKSARDITLEALREGVEHTLKINKPSRPRRLIHPVERRS